MSALSRENYQCLAVFENLICWTWR